MLNEQKTSENTLLIGANGHIFYKCHNIRKVCYRKHFNRYA